MGMTELKSCPFCGREAKFEKFYFDEHYDWKVKCTGCFAGTYFEDTQEEAAQAWNERVGDYEEY